MTTLVLTVLGDDRPGLVSALSAAILKAGGSWERSQMARLGGKFAGILLVQASEDRVAKLIPALEALDSDGVLAVRVERAGPDEPAHRGGPGSVASGRVADPAGPTGPTGPGGPAASGRVADPAGPTGPTGPGGPAGADRPHARPHQTRFLAATSPAAAPPGAATDGAACDGAAFPARRLVLELVGADRPAIMADISGLLADHEVSIEELTSGVSATPMAGGMLFEARAQLTAPPHLALDDLRQGLEKLADELMVDLALTPQES